jgi:ABC-type uncharacterized transport system permease subunit
VTKDPLLIASIATTISGGTAVMIASTGELLAERVGVYNFGIEGIMLLGALVGFATGNAADSWVVGLLVAALLGAALSLLYAFAVVAARANSVVVGIAVWFMAIGLAGQLGKSQVRAKGLSLIPDWNIPLLSDIPWVGHALFQQSVITYLGFLLPPALVLLYRTRHGIDLRSIGENPQASDAAGIPVLRWRAVYLAAGGALVGVAGGFLTLGIVRTWVPNLTAGQGWIALAIVFFAGWRPMWLIVGALLFGALETLGTVAQAEGWHISTQIFAALPYVGTVLVLCLRAALAQRRGRGFTWPAALGQPFYRG